MISFRHHIVSLSAVFLALAAGIALGGGPLSGLGRTDTSRDPAGASSAPAEGAELTEAYVEETAPAVLEGQLANQSVAVVTLPGADESDVAELKGLIEGAQGSVSGEYALTPTLLDPTEKSLVETLGSELAQQQPKGAVPAEATTYPRAGALLGRSIATTTREGDVEPAEGAEEAMDGLVTGDLVAGPEADIQAARLVLVVLGNAPAPEGGAAIVDGLIEGLSQSSVGTVVVGTVADGDGGQLEQLRDDGVGEHATSVDGIETAAGRVSAVLALKQALSESGGEFGASGTDGAIALG